MNYGMLYFKETYKGVSIYESEEDYFYVAYVDDLELCNSRTLAGLKSKIRSWINHD